MKKALLAALFLSIFVPSYCGQFWGSGEFGIETETTSYYALLELGYIQPLGSFLLEGYGGVETLMSSSFPFFSPYNADFWVGGKIKYKKIYIRMEHHCVHPVLSTRYVGTDTWVLDKRMYAGNMTRIGVGFEF